MQAKQVTWILLAILTLSFPVSAQEKSGFMYPNRFGLSYQKTMGIDVGLIAFNQWNDQNPFTFYDISLGVESFISKPFVLAPKISFDFGFGDMFTLGGGVDISMPTDFSTSAWMLTPKMGMSLATILRLYYGYHIFKQEQGFPDLGKHRISLEINLAAFHDFKIGL